MSARWTAGAVRARALAGRRLGVAGARRVAKAPGVAAALPLLAGTVYSRRLAAGMDLESAERAVERTLLWNLRVLAGWQPRPGVDLLRAVVCGYEAEDIVRHLRHLDHGADREPDHGPDHEPDHELGALSTAWNRVRTARTPVEVRQALAASPWGDPGGDTPAAVAVHLALSGAERMARLGPEAAGWAEADAASTVAREILLARRPLGPAPARIAARLLGSRAPRATGWDEYVRSLPRGSRQVFSAVAGPEDLWLVEAAVRDRAETDAWELLHRGGLGRGTVLGAAIVLSADALRVRAALECAATGGHAWEHFDAAA